MDNNNEFVSVKRYNGVFKINKNGVLLRSALYVLNNDELVEYEPEKILKHTKSSAGYAVISICINGQSTVCYIHRILAETFIPNPDNKKYVNHIDGNKMNFSLDNLEWVTSSENNKHAYLTGLKKARKGKSNSRFGIGTRNGMKGELDKKSKLILNTENGIFYHGIQEAATAYGYNRGTLGDWLRGKYKNKSSLIIV